jgi:hypothetical protein
VSSLRPVREVKSNGAGMAPQPVGKRARSLLRDQLKHGPKPAAQIEAAAKAAKIRAFDRGRERARGSHTAWTMVATGLKRDTSPMTLGTAARAKTFRRLACLSFIQTARR